MLMLVCAVVAISAHAPSQTYAYSQLRWIGIAMGAVRDGNWLLPRNHFGEVPHKPQLYIWLEGGILAATGVYHDFVFRLPTIAAGAITAVMVYLLGRRWYGRRTGLLAACLWVTLLHMGKLMYVATTDMLFSMWITASVLCVDRLLFHPAPREKRLRWLVGFWVTMILGALTKGWGLVNPVVIGAMVALAAALGPGFRAAGRQQGTVHKILSAARLVGRRWHRAAKALRLGWGLAAMLAVVAPMWIVMFLLGGEEFRDVGYVELWQRITGQGAFPPHASSMPPVLHLLYYTLPASVFAVGALFRQPLRRWFSRRRATWLPLCWTVAVVAPFSVSHGFRSDYLLPCYAAVALLGAWAVESVHRGGRGGGRVVGSLRHAFATVAVTVGVVTSAYAGIALLYPHLAAYLPKGLRIPPRMAPATWWILAGLIPAGLVLIVVSVWASLRWRIRRLAVLVVVGMPGVLFLHTHVMSRHAYTRDGEKMIAFARRARKLLGADEFAVFDAEKIAAEVYLGRFGLRVSDPQLQRVAGVSGPSAPVALLNRSSTPWLITCDRGLVGLGASKIVTEGSKKTELLLPGDLGEVRVVSQPVRSQKWGRIYLIRLRRPIRPSGRPRVWPWVPGRHEDSW